MHGPLSCQLVIKTFIKMGEMLMKFKIGVKIVISFSIITLLIILVSYIGLSGMYSVQNSYNIIIKDNLPVENLVKEVRAINLEQVTAVRGYIIYKDEQYPELYNSLSDSLSLVFQKISEKSNTEASNDYLNKLLSIHNEYDDGVKVIFDYVRKGQINEAVAYGEKIKSKVTDIKEVTQKWSEYVEKLDAERMDKTNKEIRSRIIILLILVLTAVAGSLVVGLILSRSIARPITQLTTIAGRISDGDLTQSIPRIKSKDEIKELGNAFSSMMGNLRGLILNVNDASQELVASSEELAASSEEVSKVSEQIAIAVSELAKGASEQAVSSEKGNSKILLTVEGLSRIAEEMAQSEKIMGEVKEAVSSGEVSIKYQESKVIENGETTKEVASAISSLSEKSQEIGRILEVIRSIAEQTNLLALNAAIEAARAGEAGKGFSVVADEIRKLAEQSGTSVKEIDKIIKEVQAGVDATVNKMEKSKSTVEMQSESISKTVSAFGVIAGVVDLLGSRIKHVAEASAELSKSAVQAGDEMTGIASVAQQSAASTQEVAASTEEQASTVHQITDAAEGLSQLAVQLQDSVRKFTV